MKGNTDNKIDLREKIKQSEYRTQEMFSFVSGINEAIISKYCRGMRKISKNDKPIIEKLLKMKLE